MYVYIIHRIEEDRLYGCRKEHLTDYPAYSNFEDAKKQVTTLCEQICNAHKRYIMAIDGVPYNVLMEKTPYYKWEDSGEYSRSDYASMKNEEMVYGYAKAVIHSWSDTGRNGNHEFEEETLELIISRFKVK